MNFGVRKILKKSVPKFAMEKYVLLKKRRVFWKEFEAFKRLSHDARFPLNVRNCKPYLDDKTGSTSIDYHYFFHTAWAARVLAETRPNKHIDVSSSLRFVGTVSAFIPIEYYEFRHAPVDLPGLRSGHADLCNLPFSNDTVESISCMHVVEHIGLGRYDDPIDPDGDLKAAIELQRVVQPGGQLLFVVPLAEKPVLFFNAHRVYSYDLILEMFPKMELGEFAIITDRWISAGLIRNATRNDVLGQRYACGCFQFIKR